MGTQFSPEQPLLSGEDDCTDSVMRYVLSPDVIRDKALVHTKSWRKENSLSGAGVRENFGMEQVLSLILNKQNFD